MPSTIPRHYIWSSRRIRLLLCIPCLLTPYILRYQKNQIRIELVVRLPEYSTTKPPENRIFSPLPPAFSLYHRQQSSVQTTAMSAAIETAQEIQKRNDNHVPQIREAKKKWPSRNGLCIATRRMTRIVQRKKRVYGLIVPWRIPGSTGTPIDRMVRTQPVPFI